ncbi:tail fiber assembly protein [Morganella morganii]
MNMNYYKDENNQVWAYDDEQVAGGWVKDGLIKITEQEADELRNPPPTKEQHIEMANLKKQGLMLEVCDKNRLLLAKQAMNRIKPSEKEYLERWFDYLDELEVVDTSKAPDIEWPSKPV